MLYPPSLRIKCTHNSVIVFFSVLRLSGCMISADGCKVLALALKANPSNLRELDLSFNHPGESVKKMLMDLKKDPNCQLDILKYKTH